MKKRVMLALAVCALALTIPLSAIAGNGPSNKVTGDMWFTNGDIGLATVHVLGPGPRCCRPSTRERRPTRT